MKTTRAQMKEAIETLINSMTKEEMAKSLEDAGLSFYKNIKVPIFSHETGLMQQKSFWPDLDSQGFVAITLSAQVTASYTNLWLTNERVDVNAPKKTTSLVCGCFFAGNVMTKEDLFEYKLAA